MTAVAWQPPLPNRNKATNVELPPLTLPELTEAPADTITVEVSSYSTHTQQS